MISWIRDVIMTPGGGKGNKGEGGSSNNNSKNNQIGTTTVDDTPNTTTTTSIATNDTDIDDALETNTPSVATTTMTTTNIPTTTMDRKTRSVITTKSSSTTNRTITKHDANKSTTTTTTNSSSNSPSSSSSITTITIPMLWEMIDRELRVNIGNSVKCGICLSTVTNPIRTTCIHTFCYDCIVASLHSRKFCPICNSYLTRRGIQPFQYLNEMSLSYKELLSAIALTPGLYQADFTTLTQKVCTNNSNNSEQHSNDDNNSNDDHDDDDDDDDTAKWDRYCVAKTWHEHVMKNDDSSNNEQQQISTVTKQENQQIIIANQKACNHTLDSWHDYLSENSMLSEIYRRNKKCHDDHESTTTSPATELYVKPLSSPSIPPPPPPLSKLPSTQEVQEEAREQQAADQDLQDSIDDEEEEEEEQHEQQLTNNQEAIQGNVQGIIDETNVSNSTTKAHDPTQQELQMFVTTTAGGATIQNSINIMKSSKKEEKEEEEGGDDDDDVSIPFTPTSKKRPSKKTVVNSSNSRVSFSSCKATDIPDDELIVPSPPIFVQSHISNNNKRHSFGSKSYSKRDRHRRIDSSSGNIITEKQKNEKNNDLSLLFETEEALSPIAFNASQPEPSFVMDDNRDFDVLDDPAIICKKKKNATTTTTTTTTTTATRNISIGNVTGMMEDSMGALHMNHQSVLHEETNNQLQNNNTTIVASMLDETRTYEPIANKPLPKETKEENKKQEDNATAGFKAGDASSSHGDVDDAEEVDDDATEGIDDDDLTQPMLGEEDCGTVDKEESNVFVNISGLDTYNLKNASITSDESHVSTKDAINEAATLPAGHKKSTARPRKKKLFLKGEDNETSEDENTNDDKDKKPRAKPIKTTRRSASGGMATIQEQDIDETNKHIADNVADDDDDDDDSKLSQGGFSTTDDGNLKMKYNPKWPEGTIVNVQARTWPGVNKPGGVGRITGMNFDGTYNVAYVLGGKESSIDAVFITEENQKELMDDTVPVAARRRRRPQDELPEDLLQQLAAEGFDTGNAITSAGRRGKKRKDSPTNALADATNNDRRSTGSKTTSKAPISEATTTSKRKRSEITAGDDSSKAGRSKTKRSSTNSTLSTGSMKRTSSKSRREETDERKSDVSLLEIFSNDEACKLADERYNERFQAALNEKLITIAVSNLTDDDTALLKRLCSNDLSIGVKVKVSEAINKKTTLCIIPANQKGDEGLRAKARTVKAMKSSLHGIPIITPDWIRQCEKENRIIHPTNFIRTLPTKYKEIEASGDARYGVAKLAAILTIQQKKPNLPFRDLDVWLCGNFSSKDREMPGVVTQLLKDGGAKVLSNAKDVSSSLRILTSSKPSKSKVVIVCADSGVSIPKALEKELKDALQLDRSSKVAAVVHYKWVMESISCAKSMHPGFFEPSTKKELWRLSLE